MRLWFFRTREGYFLELVKPHKTRLDGTFDLISAPWQISFGEEKPRGFPAIKLGDCVPVELAVVKESKKARKRGSNANA